MAIDFYLIVSYSFPCIRAIEFKMFTVGCTALSHTRLAIMSCFQAAGFRNTEVMKPHGENDCQRWRFS